MRNVEEALQLIAEVVQPGDAELLPLSQSAGRRLVEPIVSTVDSPPFDKSMMDGFAVRAADITSDEVLLDVMERITAGEVPAKSVGPMQATQIMTGAQMPVGADAVIKIEDVKNPESERIGVTVSEIASGKNVLAQGALLQTGETVLESGQVIRFPQIGLLAELGFVDVSVFSQPTIAILATGNELVPVDQTPGPGQIRNSNESMLVAQIENCEATAVPLGIAKDDPAELQQKIAEGLQSDFLLLTGGVSAGTLDLVPGILQQMGVREIFHKVKLKPGKPIWFGVCDAGQNSAGMRKYVFGLPGNPISSLVCFELFVRFALNCLQGKSFSLDQSKQAILQQAHLVKSDRPVYHPAKITFSDGEIRATPVRWLGSADLRGTAMANGIIYFPPRNNEYQPGEKVQAQLWHLPDC